jgi:hypothetical protein
MRPTLGTRVTAAGLAFAVRTVAESRGAGLPLSVRVLAENFPAFSAAVLAVRVSKSSLGIREAEFLGAARVLVHGVMVLVFGGVSREKYVSRGQGGKLNPQRSPSGELAREPPSRLETVAQQ